MFVFKIKNDMPVIKINHNKNDSIPRINHFYKHSSLD